MDKYKYFFGCMETLGSAAMKRLIDGFGSEEAIYKVRDKELEDSRLLTNNQLKELLQKRKKWDINKEWERLVELGIKVTAIDDEDYPSRLKNVSSAPYMLFYNGRLPDTNRPSVAIIGARMCSEYGEKMARYFAEELASHGVQIVSGLASGIDGLSQQASIDAGGDSYGVLGSGVDICYPESNRNLYERLKEKGGIISEFSLGTKPIARNFPMRNRIISGLSDIVLVIEAKPKSGTAITVSMALEQGRQVYAVPGRVCDALSQGCNRMISEGAGVALDVDCILEELERMEVINERGGSNRIKNNITFESELEEKIYNAIRNGCNCVDMLMSTLKDVGIDELNSQLIYMVMKGLIKEKLGWYEV